MKQPRFLQSDKKLFVVSIKNEYWKNVTPNWQDLTPSQKDKIMQEHFDTIDKMLQSNKKTIVIMTPMIDGKPLLEVKQVNGKKRSRIVYKSKI